MRVLLMHSSYLSGSSSGENRVVEDEARLLRDGGHEIELLAPRYNSERRTIVAALRAIWCRPIYAEVRERYGHIFKVGVVHAHNLFPCLSPAILRVPLPTVLTLHNFRLACLPATFLRDSRICEDCLGHPPWRGVVHGCYRESRSASSVIAASLTLHRAI